MKPKKKELEEMWRPIITAAYNGTGDTGRMPNMDNFQQADAGKTSSGPKIDEVD